MLKSEKTRQAVLEVAYSVACEVGYQWLTRKAVATRAGVSVGTVSGAFGGIIPLKRSVLKLAVDRGNTQLIAEGLADRSAIAQGAPPELKQQAAASLI